MKRSETFLQTALVWAFVYPCVLIFGYGFAWIAPEAPRWSVPLVGTLFTGTPIQFAGVSLVERAAAWRRGHAGRVPRRHGTRRGQAGGYGTRRREGARSWDDRPRRLQGRAGTRTAVARIVAAETGP